jgi:hypothetical protein
LEVADGPGEIAVEQVLRRGVPVDMEDSRRAERTEPGLAAAANCKANDACTA